MAAIRLNAYLEVLRAAAGPRGALGPSLPADAVLALFPGKMRPAGTLSVAEADRILKAEKAASAERRQVVGGTSDWVRAVEQDYNAAAARE
jgi:hypothetical protein